MAGSNTPAAGGLLILIGFLGGATVGILQGEPSLGVIIGVGLGIAAAVLIWLVNRRPR